MDEKKRLLEKCSDSREIVAVKKWWLENWSLVKSWKVFKVKTMF